MTKSRSKLPSTGMSELRIIGGKWRSRKLTFPEIEGLRPTGDRIRETLFNWLAPDIQGARVLDLFAGSGALGLEALSRGAESAVLVEKHPKAAANLLQHIQNLQADNAKVEARDANQYLQAGNANAAYDLVFIDPPFAAELWQSIAELLNNTLWLVSGALIYVETPRGFSWQVPANWYLHKDKQAGQVTYQLFRVEFPDHK